MSGQGAGAPVPFELRVSDNAVAELHDRLARTRWPDQPPGPPGAGGPDVGWVRDLAVRWRDEFDWRAAEARLNALPQYIVPLDGIDLHVLHVEGKGPAPMPLLLMHGWPSSVFEFLDILPRLTDPARFGGDPADAFTVVAPSLPGYGPSFAPGQHRFSANEMADTFAKLMGVLGYDQFAAQGGDWGAFIAGRMGYAHPERLLGIHVTLLSAFVGGLSLPQPTEEESAYLAEAGAFMKDGFGYATIQGTRPQTLAYGLNDSPAGLLAWIGEKFDAWSDGGVGVAIPSDTLFATTSLYWFTGAIGASFAPYYARMHGDPLIPAGATIDVPAGHAVFPREIVRPPRSVAERVFTDLRRWTVMERGGHFAALEQSEALARDVADFFRELR